jgi:hypothetical protein
MTFRQLFGTRSNIASSEEVVELTNQFYVTLRAYFARVKQHPVRNQVAFDRVTQLVDAGAVQNWTNAYEIEQLLVHLFDDETVATELGIRVIEARSVLRPELGALYDAQFHELEKAQAGAPAQPLTPSVEDRRRTLLGRLINDLQWRYIVNEATRRLSKSITRSTASLFVVALTLFLVAVATVYLDNVAFTLGDLRLVWLAGLAGAFGATFSMLATLRSRLDDSKLDDLKVLKVFAVLVSRALVGAGAACILFFFLMSGLLGGTAFPTLTEPEQPGTAQPTTSGGAIAPPSSSTTPVTPLEATAPPPPTVGGATAVTGATAPQTPPTTEARPPASGTTPSPPAPAGGANTPTGGAPTSERMPSGGALSLLSRRQLALLIVWCFIAGFSEQLIPGLLASTEARAGNATPPATDRFRPTTGTATVPAAPGPQADTGQDAAGQDAAGHGAVGGSQPAADGGAGGPAGNQGGGGAAGANKPAP